VASDQTHGLVANRSEREEQRDVDGVRATEIEDCRRILVDRSALAVVGRLRISVIVITGFGIVISEYGIVITPRVESRWTAPWVRSSS
jgi:hypothetical protein